METQTLIWYQNPLNSQEQFDRIETQKNEYTNFKIMGHMQG